jgi:hypothetical protein
MPRLQAHKQTTDTGIGPWSIPLPCILRQEYHYDNVVTNRKFKRFNITPGETVLAIFLLIEEQS